MSDSALIAEIASLREELRVLRTSKATGVKVAPDLLLVARDWCRRLRFGQSDSDDESLAALLTRTRDEGFDNGCGTGSAQAEEAFLDGHMAGGLGIPAGKALGEWKLRRPAPCASVPNAGLQFAPSATERGTSDAPTMKCPLCTSGYAVERWYCGTCREGFSTDDQREHPSRNTCPHGVHTDTDFCRQPHCSGDAKADLPDFLDIARETLREHGNELSPMLLAHELSMAYEAGQLNPERRSEAAPSAHRCDSCGHTTLCPTGLGSAEATACPRSQICTEEEGHSGPCPGTAEAPPAACPKGLHVWDVNPATWKIHCIKCHSPHPHDVARGSRRERVTSCENVESDSGTSSTPTAASPAEPNASAAKVGDRVRYSDVGTVVDVDDRNGSVQVRWDGYAPPDVKENWIHANEYEPAASPIARPARLDEDGTANPLTEIVGVYPAGKKNFYGNTTRLIARPTAPMPCVALATLRELAARLHSAGLAGDWQAVAGVRVSLLQMEEK